MRLHLTLATSHTITELGQMTHLLHGLWGCIVAFLNHPSRISCLRYRWIDRYKRERSIKCTTALNTDLGTMTPTRSMPTEPTYNYQTMFLCLSIKIIKALVSNAVVETSFHYDLPLPEKVCSQLNIIIIWAMQTVTRNIPPYWNTAPSML